MTHGVVGAFVFSSIVAPWGNFVFNPLLSAIRDPDETVAMGWGEAPAVALPIIEADAAARGLACADITVAGLGRPMPTSGCRPRRSTSDLGADYVIVSAGTRQSWSWTIQELPERYELIATPHLYGNLAAEVWRKK